MKKILDYLNLRNIGGLEIVFALSPILMGHSLGGIPLSILMWIVMMAVVIMIKRGKRKIRDYRPLTVFVIYWALHQLILLFITDIIFNTLLAQVIFFAAVYFLYPSMNPQKLRGAMNWVALFSIGGLLYQWTIIAGGGMVHPLELPGLSMAENRLETLSIRPSSFYMEPAAYVSFMVCPLAFSLMDKKYIWSVFIILSMFLTTSTTGILLSFIMLTVSLSSNKAKLASLVAVLVMGAGMFYALNTLEIFEEGVSKLENTDASTNVRLSQGPNVVSSMHSTEYIFGVPFSSAYDYCMSGRYTNVLIYGESVYMSTFWNMILLYGIVGLILYLFIYYKLFRISRLNWPLLVGLCATLFSDPDTIQSNYVYKLIFLLVIAYNDPNGAYQKKQSIKTRNNA